jgi:hypothetical protein
MKKLLLGTLVLLAFNAAVVLTQMSCKKEAKADTPIAGTPALKQLDLVLYMNAFMTADRRIYNEIYTCKLDGSNKTKISITLPANIIVGDDARLTPDGKTVVFSTYEVVTQSPYVTKDGGLYTSSTDGGTAKKIVDGNTGGAYTTLHGAY